VAGNFSGTNNYLNISTPVAINTLSNSNVFTTMCWFTTPDFTTGTVSNEGGIFSQQLDTVYHETFFIGYILSGANRVLETYVDTGPAGGSGTASSQWQTLGTTALQVNTLYHYALVWNGAATNKGSLYLNCVLDGTNTAADALNIKSSTAPFVIGGWIGSAGTTLTEDFPGQIEDVRIYNRALSSSEIQTIYGCRGTDGIVNGLVARYALQGQSGVNITSETDLSGNSQTLNVVTVAPTYASDLILSLTRPPQG
jgi:hypothetical protein